MRGQHTCGAADKERAAGTSLATQRLRLHASTAGDTGLIPGLGTKIRQAMRCGQKKKKARASALGTSRLETLVSDIRQQAGPVILKKPLTVKPFLETVTFMKGHPLGQGQSSKETCSRLLEGCAPRTQGGRTVRQVPGNSLRATRMITHSFRVLINFNSKSSKPLFKGNNC